VALQRVLLAHFAARVEVLIWANRVAGVLALPLAYALMRRIGCGPRARMYGLIALIATPGLVAEATSESMWPWALVATLLAWERWLAFSSGLDTQGARIRFDALATTVAASALALWSRPELLAILPLGFGLLSWAAWRGRPAYNPGKRAMVVAAGAGAAVVLVALAARLVQLEAAMVREAALGNTPEVFSGGLPSRIFGLLRDGLWRKNALLEPRIFPFALSFALALGATFGHGPSRKTAQLLGLLALAALVPGAADLPWVSLPRIHAPAMFFAAMAAGPATDALLTRAEARAAVAGRGSVVHSVTGRLVATGLLFVLTAAGTPALLWKARHPQVMHDTWRAALGALDLKGTQALLGRRDHNDGPDERIHLGFPDDDARRHGLRPVSLTALINAQGRERFVWLDARCAMRPCGSDAEHPSCAAVRKLKLEPVVTTTFVARAEAIPAAFEIHTQPSDGTLSDLDFPWCIARAPLQIGLYRVIADAAARRHGD
jgi:hypothetical protein